MSTSLPSELLRSLRLTLVVAAVTGVIYPLAVTGVAQGLFPGQANGSLVTRNGQVVGSALIGQEFTSPRYFHGRPSATVNARTGRPQPYAADNSGGSNQGPSNSALIDRVAREARAVRRQNGLGPSAPVPADLVTTSASGLDPDLSEASALLQVNRVAQARHLDPARVRSLVEHHLHGRVLGIFGEPYVDVLELNLALDRGEAG
ncbi:MAG TPA: potassium-transporting ATPase subunit KdpC [Candidatus Dormibacteraeota bacterium]|nr:potassium-transporting ATPase subunit KdpC [Candidatus Dormibacteraeota bacterium]